MMIELGDDGEEVLTYKRNKKKVQISGDTPGHTGKNDLMRHVTHREAVFGTVIHSIFDAWHYEVLWTCNLTRLL
jgi:hypothetical protein